MALYNGTINNFIVGAETGKGYRPIKLPMCPLCRQSITQLECSMCHGKGVYPSIPDFIFFNEEDQYTLRTLINNYHLPPSSPFSLTAIETLLRSTELELR